MSEVVELDNKFNKIIKGRDKKQDALMLMSPECNWGQFLTPAPYAVAILGNLLLISADTDFSLQDKPPKDGFKLLRYPNSFRASLVQVTNTGWVNFNTAHNNMHQIQLHCGNVDAHVKTAVKFLLRGTPQEVEIMLPMALNKIQGIADECLRLATDVEKGFVDMMSLISELLEASTSTKGVYEKKLKETQIALKVAAIQKEHLSNAMKESKDQLTKLNKEVKDAQDQFQKAIDEMPTGGQLLALQLGEAAVNFVCNLLGSGAKKIDEELNTQKQQQVGDQAVQGQGTPPIDHEVEYSKQLVCNYSVQINIHISNLDTLTSGQTDKDQKPCPDWKQIRDGQAKFVKESLDRIKKSIETQTKSGQLGVKAATLCSDSISVCDELIKMSESLSTENHSRIPTLVSRVETLKRDVMVFKTESMKQLGTNPLSRKPYHLSKMQPKKLSATKTVIENSRFKTESAKETLRDAKRRQEKTTERLQETNKKLTEVLMEMAKLNIDKVDFDTIRDTLIKGINALAELREEWSKLVRFFQMLSNIIKCCLNTSLTGFVDMAKSGRKLKIGDTTIQLSDIFRDVLFEHASKCSQIAYIVYTIASTYVKISDKFIMDRVTRLGRLITLDPKKDKHKIQIEKNKLFTGCKEAQQHIRALVMQEKEKFNENIDSRIAEIQQLEKELPPLDKQTVANIKESVTKGFSSEDLAFDDDESDDEIMDDLI